jgi:hypothetical protein
MGVHGFFGASDTSKTTSGHGICDAINTGNVDGGAGFCGGGNVFGATSGSGSWVRLSDRRVEGGTESFERGKLLSFTG